MEKGRMMKRFKEYLLEETKAEHEERFNRAIYLTYVKNDNKFKHVSEDEFKKQLNDIHDKTTSHDYNKNDIYRLADSKDVWLNKHNQVIGEIYYEDDIKSFWIYK